MLILSKTTASKRKDKSRLIKLRNDAGFILKLEPASKYPHETIA
jgi:hypothetical protein